MNDRPIGEIAEMEPDDLLQGPARSPSPPPSRPRAEASPAPMPDIPVEAGKATVTTTVSGSVLLK